jgi:hypothetical protein
VVWSVTEARTPTTTTSSPTSWAARTNLRASWADLRALVVKYDGLRPTAIHGVPPHLRHRHGRSPGAPIHVVSGLFSHSNARIALDTWYS